jgi:hypothetical protein
MQRLPLGYLQATRHPWPCLVFLIPLLLAYEAGVLWLGGTQPDALRNGADSWLRWTLEGFGLSALYWPPALVVAVFLGWSWLRRWDRPYDVLGLWIGMVLESTGFALGLWGLSRGLRPALERLGTPLSCPPPPEEVIGQVITFVGAGIYEEVLFRLCLFSGLIWLFGQAQLSPLKAVVLAALGSAAIFSAAHHIGPYGEAFGGYVFLFRTLAGLYFTLLYQLRGFAIAVGAHAAYDVLVGVLIA